MVASPSSALKSSSDSEEASLNVHGAAVRRRDDQYNAEEDARIKRQRRLNLPTGTSDDEDTLDEEEDDDDDDESKEAKGSKQVLDAPATNQFNVMNTAAAASMVAPLGLQNASSDQGTLLLHG
jgi:UDP-N-acetylmuramyl tripeptide synthase